MEKINTNIWDYSTYQFDNQSIRAAFNIEEKTWYFSIVDVIAVLTMSKNPGNYWRVLKNRIAAEDIETVTNCNGLKLVAEDGKKRLTDVVDAENLKNILNFIPSKKVGDFQIWLKNFEVINLPSYQIDFRKGIDIQKYIYIIHGVQVMFDQDVAMLFGVETKRILEQVKRNSERFPDDFMFEVKSEEMLNLRSQIATSSWGGNRYKRYAFTEYGIAQLSSVLNSETAVQMSIMIMRAFVAMRNLFLSQNEKTNQVGYLSKDFYEFKSETNRKFDLIFDAIEKNKLPEKTGIFFENSIFDAHELICSFIRDANESIVLIDNYMDETVLKQLSKKKENVKVTLYTRNIKDDFRLDVQKFNEQYPHAQLIEWTKSHDRFLIIDQKIGYDIGASLKDVGKKWFSINRSDSFVPFILQELEK